MGAGEQGAATENMPPRINVYEVRPAADGNGYELISDALAKGRMPFKRQHVAVDFATLHSGRFASLINVFDGDGRIIATHQQPGATSSVPNQPERA